MKKLNKKIVLGTATIILVATIGVVFAGAQYDETTQEDFPEIDFSDRPQMKEHRLLDSNITEHGFFFYDLTEEQQTEIDELRTSLQNQGANFSEIQDAINEKLDEFGVFDQRLDNEINQTEQRLQILNREKELREQGYSWDEIRTIIQDEFGQEFFVIGDDHAMMDPHGSGKRPCGGLHDIMPGEESNQ